MLPDIRTINHPGDQRTLLKNKDRETDTFINIFRICNVVIACVVDSPNQYFNVGVYCQASRAIGKDRLFQRRGAHREGR